MAKETELAPAPISMEEVQKQIDAMLLEAEKKAQEIVRKAGETAPAAKTVSKEIQKREKELQEPVTVKLFKDNKNYKDDVFVAVNGRTFQIKRGVEVQVPRYVKEVLDHSVQQDEATAAFIESKERDYERESKKYQ